MAWVQRIIWFVLTIFSISVLYVVFSGGIVEDEAVDERDRTGPVGGRAQESRRVGSGRDSGQDSGQDSGRDSGQGQGEMAYDRYLAGGRQNPASDRP